MKAQHLAAYFKKRIARPIQYDVTADVVTFPHS